MTSKVNERYPEEKAIIYKWFPMLDNTQFHYWIEDGIDNYYFTRRRLIKSVRTKYEACLNGISRVMLESGEEFLKSYNEWINSDDGYGYCPLLGPEEDQQYRQS